MKGLSSNFVEPISKIQYEELPIEVIDKAKICILHEIACTYAGINTNWSQAAQKTIQDLNSTGNSSIWFSNQKSNAADAAFVNAVMGQSILHEDIHRGSNAHPGIIVIPAVIALGEKMNSNGKEIIKAVVAGYEMMGRIGRGTVSSKFGERGFRPTSIIGVFGSSIAAGILLNLNIDEQIAAFGLAGNFTSGINEWAHAGSDDLYFQNGMSSKNGIIAANLAKYGVSSPDLILEGKSGLCIAYGLSLDNLKQINMYDGHYAISEVLFKPAPACALVQTTAQVALDAAKAGVNPDDIVKGEIRTFALGKTYSGCDYSGPFNKLLQARMSNQYNFAATLINNKISNENYLDFYNQKICKLANKMTVETDSEVDNKFPDMQPVEVHLEMRDGTTMIFQREEPVYLGKSEIVEKLYRYCGPLLQKDGVDRVVEVVDNLEKLNDIRQLTDLFIKSKLT